MRLLIIALVSSILLLGACFNKKPSGILSEKQMTALLTEVHLLDGYLQTLQIDSAKKVMDGLYGELLAKYNLDSTSFAKNVDYYYMDPVKTEEMYDKIQQTLNSYQDTYTRHDSIRYAHERDSLNRVSRYRTRLEFQENLWVFEPDTAYVFDRSEYFRQQYRPTGLLFLWQNTNIPMPARSQSTPTSPERITKPVGRSPLRRDPDVIEDRPVRAPESVVEQEN